MATIRSYTDLEQAKKLAEILPIESADMHLINKIHAGCVPYNEIIKDTNPYIKAVSLYPCWSLAALLDVLPKKYYPIKDHETNLLLGKPKDKWYVLYWDATGMQDGEQTLEDNPIDACYEMIIKLHKEGLL